MKKILALVSTVLFALPSFAGIQGFNGTTNLGLFSQVSCGPSGGLTCTKLGGRMVITTNLTPLAGALKTHYNSGWNPPTLTGGSSTTGSATTAYLTQVSLPTITLTGIGILNGATVGTNKYVVALYNSSGALLANSALAGITTAGANTWQQIPFTSTFVVPGSNTYWISVTINGATDSLQTIPAAGQMDALTGSVTGQTFGTLPTLTLPTSFTANSGAIVYTY